MQRLREIIEAFLPGCEQEEADRKSLLLALEMDPKTALTRENPLFHFTGSSMIVDEARERTLMVYHHIYRSWSWTGGHADGDPDLLSTARREAREETGIEGLRLLSEAPVSLEALHVMPHYKRGKYVSAHIHLNLTYGFEADASLPLRVKPDENARVGWLPIAELDQLVSEEAMLPIYHKILDRVRRL